MNRLVLLLFAMSLHQVINAQTQTEVLVTSRGTNSVLKFDSSGSYLGDFISPGGGGLLQPQDILFHPDGTVLVTGLGNSTIKRYDAATGAFLGNFSFGYSLALPTKMIFGPDSFIYVTQWGSAANNVVRFNLSGAYVDDFTAVAIPKGLSMAWDRNCDFYVAVYGNGGDGYIHRFDSQGNDKGVFISSAIIQGPTNIWFDAAGDLLVADWTIGVVHRFDSTGAYKGNFITGLTNPEGVDFLADGRILVGDWGTDGVHLVNTNGSVAGTFCIGNGLVDPNCVRRRIVSTTAVAKVKTVYNVNVLPTMGRQFTISVPEGSNRTGVSIMNARGQTVAILPWAAKLTWDASDVPEGVYYIGMSGAFCKVLVQ